MEDGSKEPLSESVVESEKKKDEKPPKTNQNTTRHLETTNTDIMQSISIIQNLANNAFLFQEFQNNVNQLQFKVNSMLMPKRQQLLNQMAHVQNRMVQVKSAKEVIVKEAKETMDMILFRLDAQETRKISSLHHDITNLQVRIVYILYVDVVIDRLNLTRFFACDWIVW